MDVIRRLQDPRLVADFQHFFGVVKLDTDEPCCGAHKTTTQKEQSEADGCRKRTDKKGKNY